MMNRSSNNVCEYAVSHIFKKSTGVIRDKETVKQKLFPHTNDATHQITNNLMEQTGIKERKTNEKYTQDSKPSEIKRDTLSYRSVNKNRNKSQQSKVRQGVLKRTNSPSLSYRSIRKTKKNKKEESPFISLDDIMESNGRIIIKRRKEEEDRQFQKIRSQKEKENRKENAEDKAQELKQQQEREKRQKMDKYLNAFLSRKGNKITFDDKGKVVYFNEERQKSAIKKRYPPSAMQYSFDEVPDLQAKLRYNENIKERAARGQAFASSVLKTMNVSKISMMNNTCMIDEYAFMKRNDLFNNNHTRQITNIPFIQVADGTSFTETNTNLSVSKKNSDRRTSHSETKSKFKTHVGHPNENSCIDVKSELMDMKDNREIKQGGKRRAQSSYACRPKSSVPLTTRGRITSVNQQLVVQLLQ